MSKEQSIYWLMHEGEPTNQHRAKLESLAEEGFYVKFFKSLQSLQEAFEQRRVAIIVIGDEGEDKVVLSSIKALNLSAVMQGVRFLLSCSRYSASISRAAAMACFRDLLPINGNNWEWMERFMFACSGRGEEPKFPAVGINSNHEAKLALPARVIWVNENQLCFESHINTEEGDVLHLCGAMARALKTKSILLKVLRIKRTGLSFRFSYKIICQWKSKGEELIKSEVLKGIKESSCKPSVKAFVAIRSNQRRARILGELEKGPFEVQTALQSRAIIDDPRHFSPRLVIVEEDLLTENGSYQRFADLVDVLPESATVVVIGDHFVLNALQPLAGSCMVKVMSEVPDHFCSYLLDDILPEAVAANLKRKDLWWIPAKHPFSSADVKIKCLVTQIHNTGVVVELSKPVSDYSLARLDSSLLFKISDQHPYVKMPRIIEKREDDRHREAAQKDSSYPYISDAHFSDLEITRQALLSHTLTKIFEKGLRGKTLEDDLILSFRKQDDDEEKIPSIDLKDEVENRIKESIWTLTSLFSIRGVAFITTLLLVTGVLLSMGYGVFVELSKHREKSGKKITEQLLEYAK